MLKRTTNSLGRLICVTWAYHLQVRYRSQSCKVFNWLMSRSIFTDSNRVVTEHKETFCFGECRQPNGWLHVIKEYKEGSANGIHPTMQGHSHHRRSHGMLTHPVIHLTSLRILCRHRSLPGEFRSRISREVRRTRNKSWLFR